MQKLFLRTKELSGNSKNNLKNEKSTNIHQRIASVKYSVQYVCWRYDKNTVGLKANMLETVAVRQKDILMKKYQF